LTVKVRFYSSTWFSPGGEADFYVVQAWSPDTEQWYYHLGHPGRLGFTHDEAEAVSKKVALAMEIDETKWHDNYPSTTFEMAEMKGMLPNIPPAPLRDQ